MRNSSKLLALGLVLFLGACSLSAEDTAFLDKVKGKTAFDDATTQDDTTKIGSFSKDGKEFTPVSPGQKVTFDEATDANTAKYAVTVSGTEFVYTITTADGKTGSVKAGSREIDAWLK